MSARVPAHAYQDPLDRIWLATAARLGFAVRRSAEVFAASDGAGTVVIGSPEVLDPDDCLAQMIFHELCHALTEGERAAGRPDWGLCNQSERDVEREHACLRVQAALAGPWGLRRLLAPTTEFRAFYDQLPADPLSPARAPSAVAARLALGRAERAPWTPHLVDALAATAAVAAAAAGYVEAASAGLAPLWSVVEPAAPRHPAGYPNAAAGATPAAATCGTCAWRFAARGASRCRQAGVRIDPAWPACERWEADLDCQDCGACCRGAYDSVTVSRRDPVVRRHPDLIVRRPSYVELARDGDRCAALGGGREPGEPFACAIYADRPRPCRDFERAGAHCLEARRRVGLSR